MIDEKYKATIVGLITTAICFLIYAVAFLMHQNTGILEF